MTAKRWTGTAYADITTKKRWTGTAWTDLTTAKRWDGSAWVDIGFAGGGGGLQLSASTGLVTGLFSCDNNVNPNCLFVATVTTNSVTITPSGGSGAGPTYSWQYVSGDSSITPNSPTAATTTFTGNVSRNLNRSAIYKCVVVQGTDTREIQVEANISYAYIGGGIEP